MRRRRRFSQKSEQEVLGMLFTDLWMALYKAYRHPNVTEEQLRKVIAAVLVARFSYRIDLHVERNT